MNTPVIKLRAVKAVAFLSLSLLTLVSLDQAARAATADTVVTVVTSSTDLSLGATYSPSGVATGGTDDVEFTGSYTNGTTFNTNGATLNYGTLDDLDTTQSLIITNNNATASILELSAVNSDDVASGAASSDLLYVKSGGNLTIQNGAGTLTLQLANNNSGNIDDAGTLSLAGPISITAGKTVTFDGAGTTTVGGSIGSTTGAVTVSAGTTNFNGTNTYSGGTTVSGGTLNLAGSSSSSNFSVSGGAFNETSTGVISGASVTLTQSGGTTTLIGANTYGGATTVSGGTLLLDFSQTGAPTSNIINNTADSSALTLGGGKLQIKGKSSATNSQQFNGITLTAGTVSSIVLTQNSASSLSLSLGALTRNTGSLLDITLPSAGSVTASSASVTNGVFTNSSNGVAGVTVNGGVEFAANSGGTITALTPVAGTYGSTANVLVGTTDAPASGAGANTLTFNGASDAVTFTGVNAITAGGILVTPSATGAASITSGTIAAGAGKELVVINNDATTSGTLSISSIIQDSSSGASALTIGGVGRTVLSGVNTFTGQTTLLGGTLDLSNSLALQNSTLQLSAGSLVFDSSVGANAFTLGALSSSLNISLVNNAGTPAAIALSVGGDNASTTYSGILSGAGSLIKNGSGTFTLSTSETYTGPTTINGGTLQIGNISLATSAVSIGSGAFLAINLGNASNSESGQFTNAANPAFTGSGGLIVNIGNPNDSFTTNRVNTYTGPTEINARGADLAGVASTYSGSTQTGGAYGINSTVYFSNNNSAEEIALNGFNNQIGSIISQSAGYGYVTLGGPTGRNAATLTFGGDNLSSATFSGIISDNNASGNTAITTIANVGGSIVKIGTGDQTLTGNNLYAGSTTIAGGTLTISNIANGGVATTASSADAGTNTLSVSSTNGLAIGQSLQAGGVAGGGAPTITAVNVGSVTLSAVETISSGAALYFGTGNTLGISGSAASNLILDGGTLQYAGAAAAGTTNRLFQIGLSTDTGAATATIDSSSALADTLSFTNTGAIGFGLANQADTLVLTGSNSGANTLTPAIGNNGSGLVSVVKSGSGTWVLGSASNTFSGGLTINSGILRDGNANSGTLGAGNVTLATTGAPTLDLDGNNATVGLLAGGTSTSGTVSDSVSSTTSTLTLNGAGSQTYAGILANGAGTLALNMAGGTEILTGANTYTGTTTLTGGTLKTATAGIDGSNTTNGIVFNGGTLQAATGGISTAKAVSVTGGGTFDTNGITSTLSGAITGSGGLTVADSTGGGLLILSGNSAYGGTMTLNGGTTRVTGSMGGSVNVSGGTLTGVGNGSTTGMIGGLVTVAAGSGIDFSKDGLVLNPSTGTTTLTLDGGLTLTAGGNSLTSSYITINGNSIGVDMINDLGALTLNGSGNVIVNVASNGLTSGTYNLIDFTSISNPNNDTFTIGTRPTGLISFTFNTTSNAEQLIVSATPYPAVAYWSGAYLSTGVVSTGALNSWGGFNATGPITNWSDSTGTVDAGQVPGAITDVVFSAGQSGNGSNGTSGASLSGAAINSVLSAAFAINSLTFNSTPGSVSISGSAITINALASSAGGLGYSAGTGIVDNSGTSSVTIASNLIAANNQSWANNSTLASGTTLTISGNVTGLAASGSSTVLSMTGNGAGSTNITGSLSDGGNGGKLALVVNSTGAGATVLSSSNSYSGGTTLTAGVLAVNNSAAIGSGTFTISGGTLDNTSGAPETLSANNPQNWNGNFTFAGSNALNLGTGAVTMSGSTQVTVTANTLTVGGAIGGTGAGLALAGGGTLVLGTANTYSGNTTIASAATLFLGNTLALQNSTLDFSNGTLGIGGLGAATFGGLIGTNASQTLSLTNTNSTAVALTVGGNGSSGSYAGALSGLGSVTKVGAGVLALNGNDSYAGLTTVNGGELDLGGSNSGAGGVTLTSGTLGVNNSNALGSGGTLAINGGALRNTSGSAVTNAVANPITIGGSFGYSTSAGNASNNLNLGNGAVTLGSSGLTITLNGAGALAFGGSLSNTAAGANTLTVNDGLTSSTFGSVSFGGWALSSSATSVTDIVNGSGNVNFTGAVTNGASTASGLTYAGTGMLTLSASDTYTGNTTLTSGTLNLNAAGAISAGTLTYNSAGTLVENAANALSGTAALTVASGALTLSQPNNYTGATTINGGSLTFAGSGALPAATAISLGSATLSVANDGSGSNGTINLGNSITISGASTTDTINVGNNGSGNTGNTVAFGALANGTAAQNNAVTINFTGSNGYQESFTSLALSGLGGQGTTLNPTTTSVTIAGPVTNQITTTGATHFDTLTLSGTSTGNFITGSISDSPVYTAVNAGDTRVTMAGTGAWTLAGLGTYHGPTAVSGGTLNLTGTLTNTQSVATSGTGIFVESSGGSITGAATFGQGSSGISTLAGINTYTGATTVSGGTLEFVNETSLYDDVTSNWTASKIIVQSGGTLAVAVNGAGEFTTSDINTLLGISTNAGGFESGAAIGIDTTAGGYTWSSVLANTYFNNDVLGLEKLGSNTLTLTAANTYTGSTTILGGTLDLDNQYAAQYSLINLNGGSLTFDAAVSGTAFNIGGLAGSGNLALQNTSATPIALTFGNGGGTNSGDTATNGTYTGVLSGGGSLTKIGDNTEIFGGASTYAGPTAINAGTLELNFAQSGAPTSNILYNGVTPGALTMGGVASSTQTLNNPNITLNVASASTGNQSQTFASLTLGAGYETISTTDNGTGNVLVNLNGITENPGSVLNVNAAGTASATNAVTTTNSNDPTGILGGWAVVGSGTGYATVNGSGQIVAYTGYNNIGTGTVITDDGGSSSNANVELQSSSGATVTLSGVTNGATNINTLFYNSTNSATVSLTSGTLRLGANGGILENAGGKTLTISGGTLTAGGSTLDTTGTLSIIDTSANNETITLNSVIANNNSLTGAANSAGDGAVTLTIAGGTYGAAANAISLGGTNTYSGGTYVDGGRLNSTNIASFGTGQVTVLPGAQVIFSAAGTYANAFNIAGIGQGEVSGFVSALRFLASATVGGQITLLGDSTIQVQTGAGTLAGGITGNYNLNLYGSANQTLILSGATTIGGNLSINGFVPGVATGSLNDFVVEVTNASALPSGSSAGNVIINGGNGDLQVLDIHGVSAAMNGLIGTGLYTSEEEVTNLATAGSNATLTLGNNNATATFGGNIIQTSGDGTLAIVKTGSGTQVLAGSGDTFTGGLTINQGTIQDANSNSGVLGTGNVTFGTSNTPTLDLDGNSPTVGLLSGAGANGIVTDSLTSSTSTLTLGSGSQTFGGSIQNGNGTIALTLLSGTQVLTGANTYTGTTTVDTGGILNIGGGGATGSAGSGALVLNGGSLVFNETGSPTQTFSSTTIGNGALSSNVTAASGDTLVLGALTRAAGGGAANFGGAGVIDTTTANQAGTGILGGWATFGGNTFAVSAGTGSSEGQITGLASSAYTLTSTAGSVAANYTGGNVDVNSSPILAGPVTVNTMRFNTAAPEVLALTGNNVISAGGILVTSNVGNNTSTISGGTIEAGGGELVINQNNLSNGLNIFSAIADDGAPTALTLVGGGNVTLFGVNTYTGATTINAGVLTVDAGSLGSTAITVNVGTLAVNGSTGSGGSVTINSSTTLTGAGTIGGNVVLNNGTISLSNGVIGGNLSVNTGSATSNWSGAGTVNGAIAVNGSGNFNFATNSVLVSPGGITFNNASNIEGNGTIIGNITFNSTTGSGPNTVFAGATNTVTFTGNQGGTTGGFSVNSASSFGGGLFINPAAGQTAAVISYNADSGTVFGVGPITFGTTGTPDLDVRLDANIATGLLYGAGTNGNITNSAGQNDTLFLYGLGQTGTFNGTVAGETSGRTDSIVVAGGTQILGGANTAVDEYFGVIGGTLQFGTAATGASGSVASPDILLAGGGTILFESKSTASTQTVASIQVDPGYTNVTLVNNGAGMLLTDGNFLRSTGGVINYNEPSGTIGAANGITTTTLNNAGGIIAGWATVGGTDWAVNSTNASGGNIVGLSSGAGYTAAVAGTTAPAGATANVDFQASNSSSWATGAVDSLRFNTTAADTLAMTAGNTLTVTSGGILVTNNVGANTTTISGGTITSSTDLVLIQNNTSGALVINSQISDTIGLTIAGAGTVNLTGTDTGLTGVLYLDGGVLNTGTAGLGGVSSMVLAGGTLQAQSSTVAITSSKAISLGGQGGVFDNNGSISTLSGAITSANFTGASYSAGTSGIIGIGALTAQGSGELILSSAGNTWNGGLIILSGTVEDANGNANTIGEGIVTFGGSNTPTLDLHGNSPTVAALAGASSNGIILNSSATTATITLNLPAAVEKTFSGLIENGSGAVAVTINGVAGGIETFTNANTYTGTTTITLGSLDLSNARAVQNSTVALNGGSLIFDQSVTANAFTIGGLSGSAALALQNNASTPAGIALTVGGNNAGTSYSGLLTGAGSLTKVGTGTLTLSGNEFYTGATSISVGTVSISGTMSGTSSVVTSGGGAFTETSTGVLTGPGMTFTQGGTGSSSLAGLNIYTGATSVSAGSLTLAGTLNGTPSVATSGAGAFTETSTGLITGNGVTFTQGSTALSTLAGENTYTGATFINGGVLNAGSADAAGVSGPLGNGGAITFGGGTLQYSTANGGTDYSARIVNSTSAISIDTNQADVTFANALASSNTGGLVVKDSTGTGNLTLTGANAYGGSTTVEDGGYLFDGATAGAIPVASTLIMGGTDNSGGTFDLDGNNQTVAGLISQGSGGSANLVTNTGSYVTSTLTVSGNGGTFAGQIADSTFGFTALTVASGTETLSANNAYSGATTVTGGALIVSGSLSGSTNGFTAVSVTGGTLGGTGMIAEGGGSNLTVSNGGTLAPGLSANGLKVNLGSGGGSASLALQAGSTFQLTINNSNAGTSGSAALSDYSKLTLGAGVSGTLAGAISVNQGIVNSGDLFTVLILNGQQVSGTFSNSTLVSGDTYSFTVNGQNWLINYDYNGSLGETAAGISASNFESITGGDEVALLAEVPEPGTWAMLLAGMAMLVVLQRSRRRI